MLVAVSSLPWLSGKLYVRIISAIGVPEASMPQVFQGREEAASIALAAGQITKELKRLHSEDLY